MAARGAGGRRPKLTAMGLQNPFARRRLIGRNGRILNRGRLGRPVGAFRFSDLFESRWTLALFSADKLANRGSAQAQAILTNVQDFIVNLWNHLKNE